MRIAFMGTPQFAVPTLRRLHADGHDICAVYTRAPKPAGRGQGERRSPVHQAAEGLGVPVQTPRSLRDTEVQAQFSALDADLAVVVAYGLLLPVPVLQSPRQGCLNLHGSLLPRWRGAAPIQRAVMAGDLRTGVMVMRMEEGLDTGPVALTFAAPIGPDTTAGDLHDLLMESGAALMAEAVARLAGGTLRFTPQPDEGVTYAAKIDKGETRIDWRRPAGEVHNYIRGLSPFPGAWFELPLGERPVRIKVLRSTLAPGEGSPGTILGNDLTIACGSGAVRLLEVQREGKGAMDAEAFVRGTGPLVGRSAG